MKKKIAMLIVSISIFSISAGLEAYSKVSLYYDIGHFNKQYRDAYLVNFNKASFPNLQNNAGAEFYHRTADNRAFGCGFNSTTVASGSIYNRNHYEYNPFMLKCLPYAFIGYHYNFWGWELGVTAYFHYDSAGSRSYYSTDGNSVLQHDDTLRMSNKGSHAFVNGLIRIFPENWIHLKFRFGRERFNSIDSLLNIALVFPVQNYTVEADISFLNPQNYMPDYINQDGILKCNQQFSISYTYHFDIISVGCYSSVLIYNAVGGNANDISIYNRLRCGLITSVKW